MVQVVVVGPPLPTTLTAYMVTLPPWRGPTVHSPGGGGVTGHTPYHRCPFDLKMAEGLVSNKDNIDGGAFGRVCHCVDKIGCICSCQMAPLEKLHNFRIHSTTNYIAYHMQSTYRSILTLMSHCWSQHS